jgi:hypothetical protein
MGIGGLIRLGVCVMLLGLLAGCQQSVKGQQLDIQYATSVGTGSMVGKVLQLPHGRYTMFSSADPPACVKSVALLDGKGNVVLDDAGERRAILGGPPVVGAGNEGTIPSFVQQELRAGKYQLRVTANGSSCAWQVQQILNYILDDTAPPKPAAPRPAPSVQVSLGIASSDYHFRIPVAGTYDVRWTVTPCGPYSGDLLRNGNVEHLGDGAAASAPPGAIIGPQGSDAPMFLGAGDWTASVKTRCFWHIDIAPWKGSLGGGTQGFAS